MDEVEPPCPNSVSPAQKTVATTPAKTAEFISAETSRLTDLVLDDFTSYVNNLPTIEVDEDYHKLYPEFADKGIARYLCLEICPVCTHS